MESGLLECDGIRKQNEKFLEKFKEMGCNNIVKNG